MTGCSIFNFFKEVPIATSFELQVYKTAITIKFLKRHLCHSFSIEINMLLAIFNNKEKGNFKVKSNHARLKKNIFKFKCYQIG